MITPKNHVAHRIPVSRAHCATEEHFVRLGFHVFLIFFSGAFGLTLGRAGAASIIQIILFLGGTWSIWLLSASTSGTKITSRCWPLLLLCSVAFISTLWSVDPVKTINRGTQLTFGTLFGIALVSRLGCVDAIRLLIRSLSFGCVLSVFWAIGFPDLGTHTSADSAQTIHSGLWRGIFSHKISLGCYAGLTFALQIFYGWRAFSSPLSFVAAVTASAVCVLMSGSATGLVTALVMSCLLYITGWVTGQPYALRRGMMRLLNLALGIVLFLIFTGTLNQLATMLGRSGDLTGRSEYWQHIFEFMHTGNMFLGYGYAAGYEHVGSAIAGPAGMKLGEAHNGLIEMIVAFGYLGALLVVWVHGYLFIGSAQLIKIAPSNARMITALPYSFIGTLLVSCYAESIILEYRGIWTVMLGLATACFVIVMQAAQKAEDLRRIPRTIQNGSTPESAAQREIGRPNLQRPTGS